jgi:hypothetical protein
MMFKKYFTTYNKLKAHENVPFLFLFPLHHSIFGLDTSQFLYLH